MNPISIPVAELKPALAGLGKIISRRTTLPVLGCVKIERTKTGRIEITGTDLDTTGVVTLDTLGQGDATALLIPFDDLSNVAKSCARTDTVIIAALEPNRVAIKFPVSGQLVEHRCESLPAEEFPPVPEIRGEPTTLDAAVRQAISQAMQCASPDPTRLILNGAYLDVSSREGHYVVGTDGRHLFSSNSFALPLKGSLIIPNHRFLDSKDFNADGDWSLRVGEPDKDQAAPFEIATSHWRFIARSFDGNYPNWRQVVPATGGAQTTIEVEPQAANTLAQTIARLPNHDTTNFTIRLEVTKRRVTLLVKSSAGEPWRAVGIEGVKASGKDVVVQLNRQLLTKALRFGLTRIEIIDELAPLRFSEGGRQMIVMPIRPAAQSSPITTPSATTPATTPTETPPPPAEQPETNNIMPEENGNTKGGASRAATTSTPASSTTTSTPETAEKSALETALAQIESVRGDFRNAAAGLNKLADALKAAQREQKASGKEILSVRQTLRSLQSVRI